MQKHDLTKKSTLSRTIRAACFFVCCFEADCAPISRRYFFPTGRGEGEAPFPYFMTPDKARFREALMKSARADGERFCAKRKYEK